MKNNNLDELKKDRDFWEQEAKNYKDLLEQTQEENKRLKEQIQEDIWFITDSVNNEDVSLSIEKVEFVYNEYQRLLQKLINKEQ